MSAMRRWDRKRARIGDSLVNKDELITIVLLLEFESELRAAGQVLVPRMFYFHVFYFHEVLPSP